MQRVGIVGKMRGWIGSKAIEKAQTTQLKFKEAKRKQGIYRRDTETDSRKMRMGISFENEKATAESINTET